MIWYEYKGEDIEKILEFNASDYGKWVEKTMHATCTFCGKNYLYWKNSPILKKEYWEIVLKKLNLVEFEKKAIKNFVFFKKKTGCLSVLGTKENRIKRITGIVPSDCHCTICDVCMEKAIGEPLSEKNIDIRFSLGKNYLIGKKYDK